METDRHRPLSARRRITSSTNFGSAINDFLRSQIDLARDEDIPDGMSAITPRRPRTRNADGTLRITSDDILAARRRAFELRHQIYVEKLQENSEREWMSRVQYRKWKTKKALKSMERPREGKDEHVLENVISERNAYYLDSVTSKPVSRLSRISNTRRLPSEMRYARSQTRSSVYWG
jgi:hypothetical protein